MFTRIAVPLDGSALAEQALPVAIRLAQYLKASVILLHVIELSPFKFRSSVKDQPIKEAAQSYLQGVCNDILNSKMSPPFEEDKLDYRVVYDEKPGHLARIAAAEKADLVVMTTHGRTGVSRLVMGSVAGSIVRHSDLPVVLVHPHPLDPGQPISDYLDEALIPDLPENPTRIVVPLDSLPESENSLATAATLAEQLNATIYLLNVISAPEGMEEEAAKNPNYSSDLPLENSQVLIQTWKNEVFEYLEEIQEGLEAKGLKVVKVVRVGNPAEQIADFINLAQPSLLVMATHARDRLGRALLGNFSEQVLTLSNQPVVMVHT